MENWEIWLQQARRYSDCSKETLDDDFHEVAYYLALHAGELALKTVLVKCGIFSRQDETHNMLTLLGKIENNNCLPYDVINMLKEIVEPPGELSHVDVVYADSASPSGGVTIDCEAAMTSNIRYPIESVAPYQYISPNDAKDKVELSNKLISILAKHFSL